MRTSARLSLAGFLAACGLVAVTPATSYACSCAMSSDPQQLRWADVVFTGVLTDLEPPPQRALMSSGDPNTFTFTVHDVRKGDAGPVTYVKSAMSSATCGLEGMEVGAEYVVYAYVSRGELWTGSCTGTVQTVSPADLDIAAVTGLPASLWAVLHWA